MPSNMNCPLALLVALSFATSAVAGLPEARPEAVGLDASRLSRVEDAIARAVGEKKIPGAVVVVGRKGKVALARAFGKRSVEPIDEPMTRDTVFDMASLTKPIATASSVMVLLERGKIRLTDKIITHLPELKGNFKDSITIDQLLRHRAGLIPDNPIADYVDGPETAWRKIGGLTPQETPGDRFIYSDVG
jgi:CubicO group peptidase (beta-lactamase class C family)